MIDALNKGSLFFTYVGHGFAQGLDTLRVGGEYFPILNMEDVDRVAIKGTPPAVFVLACTTAMFDGFKDFEPSFLDINTKVEHNLGNEKIIESWYEDQIAGYAIYQPPTGRISQLAVRQELRGRGLGTELIRRIQGEATNRTVTIINIPEGETTNQALAKIGFENQLDQYEMELRI